MANEGKIVVKMVLEESDFDKKLSKASQRVKAAIEQKFDAPIIRTEATAAQRAARFKTAAEYASRNMPPPPTGLKFASGLAGDWYKAKMKAEERAEGERIQKEMGLGPEDYKGSAKKGGWMDKLGSLGSSSSLVNTLKKFGEAFPAVAGFAKGAALATGALVALRVAFGLVGYAVGLVLGPLKMFAHVVEQAAEAGARLYARVLASGGLPTGYVSQVSMAARVGGMSEADVVKFGSALGSLTEMTRVASNTMAKAVIPLTQLSWYSKAFGENWNALMAQFTAAAAPAISSIIQVTNAFLRILQITGVGTAIGRVVSLFEGIAAVLAALTATYAGILQLMGQMMSDLISSIYNWKLDFSKSMAVGDEIVSMWTKMAKPESVGGMAQRMPASAWEKMGLVIGMGPGVNPQAETASNTRTMKTTLSKVESNTATMVGLMSGLRAGSFANGL